jgi:hypothetical protein
MLPIDEKKDANLSWTVRNVSLEYHLPPNFSFLLGIMKKHRMEMNDIIKEYVENRLYAIQDETGLSFMLCCQSQ